MSGLDQLRALMNASAPVSHSTSPPAAASGGAGRFMADEPSSPTPKTGLPDRRRPKTFSAAAREVEGEPSWGDNAVDLFESFRTPETKITADWIVGPLVAGRWSAVDLGEVLNVRPTGDVLVLHNMDTRYEPRGAVDAAEIELQPGDFALAICEVHGSRDYDLVAIGDDVPHRILDEDLGDIEIEGVPDVIVMGPSFDAPFEVGGGVCLRGPRNTPQWPGEWDTDYETNGKGPDQVKTRVTGYLRVHEECVGTSTRYVPRLSVSYSATSDHVVIRCGPRYGEIIDPGVETELCFEDTWIFLKPSPTTDFVRIAVMYTYGGLWFSPEPIAGWVPRTNVLSDLVRGTKFPTQYATGMPSLVQRYASDICVEVPAGRSRMEKYYLTAASVTDTELKRIGRTWAFRVRCASGGYHKWICPASLSKVDRSRAFLTFSGKFGCNIARIYSRPRRGRKADARLNGDDLN